MTELVDMARAAADLGRHMGESSARPESVDPVESTGLPNIDLEPSELALELVRLRAQRRIAWMAHLRQSIGHDGLVTGFSYALHGGDLPQAEAQWFAAQEGLADTNTRIDQVQRALFGDEESPLGVLESALGLDAASRSAVIVCWAHRLDPNLGDVFAHLQQGAHRRYPTEQLISRLFGHGRVSVADPSSATAVWRVIERGVTSSGEAASLSLDPTIVAWLEGRVVIDPRLLGVVSPIPVHAALPSWEVSRCAELIARSGQRASSVRQVVVGSPGTGRRSFSAALAASFGLSPLAVDSGAIADDDFDEVYIRLQRMALLGGFAPVWHGGRLNRAWPRSVEPAPLCFITCEDEDEVGPAPFGAKLVEAMPAATLDERRVLWRSYVPAVGDWNSEGFESLTARHRLSVADIAGVGARAPRDVEEAAELAREATRGRLGDLGRLLPSPFGWEDLVLTKALRERLESFSFEARDRVEFWEDARARRLFPRGTGLVGLMSGTPGTGKTMAAQVIAAELELDLFRIDLATVVSKYIGETAKNLKRVFSRASRMSAVLLFDEADALFSKRTDVRDSHDRYANADTNYLLQLLEDYRGVALLATNKRNNIDPAFIRRVRYVFEFKRPDRGQRLDIWRKVVSEMASAEVARRLALGLEAIAGTAEVSGAQVKNAVLAAMFVARRSGRELSLSDLLVGLDLELEKEGRALPSRQKEQLLRYG